MIKLGDKIIAIESKNRRMKLDSLINSKPETIHFDLEKMIENPLLQLYGCIKKLIERNHPVLQGVRDIYLVVVTQGSIATLPPFIQEINDRLFNLFEIPIKSIHHLDIEEYEWLLAIAFKKGASPIFNVLDNKTKLAPVSSFRNFAFKNCYSKKRLKFLNGKFLQHTNDFGQMLVGDQWKAE
ncbi:hypothetical protein D3C81_1435920 [compost metagenome]